MSVHHEDSPSPQEGGKKQVSTRSGSSKSYRTLVQQAALDGALRSRDKQDSTKPFAYNLLDPLADERPNPAEMLPRGVTYSQTVSGILSKHPLGRLYQRMLEGYHLNPPVFSLALLAPANSSGEIGRFKSILSNIRQDLSVRYPDAVAREAAIWGVARPNPWEVSGYMQELSRIGVHGQGKHIDRIELALIKNAGVRNLQGFLHKVQHKMYAWNPLPVWEKERAASISCAQAGEIYVQAVRDLLPPEKHEVARNLAAIVWNRYKLGDSSLLILGEGIKGLQIADSALRAAIANHTPPGAVPCCTSRDVLEVLNPSNKRFAKDLDTIFKKLGIGIEAPQRTFLTTLVSQARTDAKADVVLSGAIESIATSYSRDDVENLCRLEYSLLPQKEPTLQPIPDKVEYKLEDFLVSILRSYVEATQKDFLIRLVTLQTSAQLDARTGLNGSEIAKLCELSTIVAGIPKTRLYEAVYGDSGVRP